jgi:hypothetical protein
LLHAGTEEQKRIYCPSDPFPFKDYWSVVLSPQMINETHKFYFDQLRIPVADDLMPHIGFQKSKGLTLSATSMNIVQKPFKKIVEKGNQHIKVMAWMKK